MSTTLTLEKAISADAQTGVICHVKPNAKGSPAYFGVSSDGAKFVLLCDGETQSAVLLDLTTNACQYVRQKGLFTNSCFATVAETETGYETLIWAF